MSIRQDQVDIVSNKFNIFLMISSYLYVQLQKLIYVLPTCCSPALFKNGLCCSEVFKSCLVLLLVLASIQNLFCGVFLSENTVKKNHHHCCCCIFLQIQMQICLPVSCCFCLGLRMLSPGCLCPKDWCCLFPGPRLCLQI